MRSLPVVFLLTIVFDTMLFAVTIHVPGDYPTIQAAIDAAAAGDTVLAAPGTYVENVDFLGKTVTLESGQGPGSTVIDGNQNGSVVSFLNAEGPDSVLEGFTITNGTGTLFEVAPGDFETYGGGSSAMPRHPPSLRTSSIETSFPAPTATAGESDASITHLP
jgi:hypothetical protein